MTTPSDPLADAALLAGAEADLLRAVIDHVEDAIVACDAAGVLRYFNRAAQELHGRPAEALPADAWAARYGLFEADGVTPLAVDRVPLVRALRDGEVRDAAMVIIAEAGRLRHVVSRGRAIFDARGEKVGAVVTMHEVTDRKLLERAREELQLAQLAAVVSSVADGIVAAEPSGHVVDWNEAALAIHGFASLEEARKHLSVFPAWFELRTPSGELLPLDAWPMARVLRGEAFSDMEVRLRRIDLGWEKVVTYAGRAVRDVAGRIAMGVLTIRDVTDRRRAEDALARSRAQMEIVVEGANVGIWYCPLPFDRLIWDAKVKEHFHLPPGAEVTIDTFYERIHPDDRERTRRAIEESIAGRSSYDIEYRTISPDGSRTKWIHALGRGVYDAAGEPRRFDGITIDVTEKKRVEVELRASERRFRDFADAAPAMLWIAEPDGQCSFLSRGWYEFTGQNLEEGLGSGWTNAIHPEERDAAGRAFREASDRRVPYSTDFRLRRRDGAYRWVIDRGLPRLGPDGELLGFVGSVIDVHERKVAEERLRESETRLREALSLAQIGTFEIDLATDAVTVDGTGRAIYGWGPDEPGTFARVQTHFHPEDRDEVLRAVDAALVPGGSGELEVEQRIRRTDGAVRWIRVRGRAAFEGRGPDRRATRLVGTYLDVTERKEAVEREALQRRLIESVIEHVSIGIAIVDGRDLRYRLANPAYLALVPGEPAGGDGGEARGSASPAIAEACRRVLERDEPSEVIDEPRISVDPRTGERRERFFSRSIHRMVLPAERDPALLLTVWETTERKAAERSLRESEERFRQLANSIPQLAWVAGPDGWISWYNDRWYAYTGTTPAQMEGWGWQSVHDPDVLPAVMERWTASIASGQSFDMTFPLRGADGIYRPFLTRVAPLHDASGRIALWFGTNTDISEKELLLAERQTLLASEKAARERAEQESRLKDEFLATLSHELRTPLNAILGWSRMIGRATAEDASRTREGIRVIERNARIQAQLIDDLLEMSRIAAGTLRLDLQSVDAAEIVRAACDTARPAAEAKGVALRVDAPAAASPAMAVRADPGRLQQVVWNVVHNAVKFTPRGGTVEVRLARVLSSLEIVVRDTGEGIAPAFLPHVFDRFRQADGSVTRRHGGLGLGLSIAKQLIELHGGTLRAESAGEGCGSTFTVRMPVAALQPTSAAEPVAQEEHADLAGLRVLAIDDERDARDLLGHVLAASGAGVVLASSAREAIDAIRRDRFDLIVADIGMPDVDGYELLRRVRRLGPAEGGATPAIALTALARSDDRIRAIEAGYQLHLAKPCDPAVLVAAAAALAREPRAR